jgi:hypothetical protein
MALTKETPALRSVLKAAFGTDSAKEIEEMGLSAKEMTDGLLRGMKAIETSTPGLDEQALAVEGRKKQFLGADREDNNGSLPDRVPSDRPDLEAMLADGRAKKELANRSAINRKLGEMNMADQEAADLAAARRDGDDEYVANYEKKVELAKLLKDLEKDGAKVAADQVEVIKKQIELRREDARIAKVMQAEKDAAKEGKGLDMQGMRHMGRNRRADKAEDADRIKALTDGGLDEATAKDLVRRQRDQEADERLGPGRRRIRNLRRKGNGPAIPERDGNIPAIPADVMPLPVQRIPGKGTEPGMKPESTGVGGDMAIKVLERIENNTRKTAAEQQQPAKRS